MQMEQVGILNFQGRKNKNQFLRVFNRQEQEVITATEKQNVSLLKKYVTLDDHRVYCLRIDSFCLMKLVPRSILKNVSYNDKYWDKPLRFPENTVNKNPELALYQGKLCGNITKLCLKSLPSNADQPLLKCGKCKNIYYCSRECQTIDWKRHKIRCATT